MVSWCTAALIAIVASSTYSGTAGHAASPHPAANPHLGPLTNDAPQWYDKLSPFQQARPVVRQNRKVAFLLFETAWDGASATDRWGIVKALDQFGTWSNLRQGKTTVPEMRRTVQATPKGPLVTYGPPLPTYDWSRARYRSRYVTFLHYTLQVRPHGPLRRLPPRAESLFVRYRVVPEPVLYGGTPSIWPTIGVGGYAMHGGFTSALQTTHAISGPAPDAGKAPFTATFDGIRNDILRGGSVSDAPYAQSGWVSQLNSSVSVMVALICHADGQRPTTVCHRSTIRGLMKRIK